MQHIQLRKDQYSEQNLLQINKENTVTQETNGKTQEHAFHERENMNIK